MDDQYGLSNSSNYRPYFPMTSVDPFFPVQLDKSPFLIQEDHSKITELAPNPTGFGNYQQFGGDSRSATAVVAGEGGGGGGGRWPRQETLALLEIRTRLDAMFKEANQKGPLWDQVSRIMSEEHGYHRSGKKCKEKFENLYKYYKKTKEGKAGRQDGKNYRFFRQLEAIYNDNTNCASASHEINQVGYNFNLHYLSNNNNYAQTNQEPLQAPKLRESLSLCDSSEFHTSSSDENAVDGVGSIDTTSMGKKQKRRGGKSWKTKIKGFIDSQMMKVMEKQEEWLEKTTRSLEKKEQERVAREEEWRKQEVERVEREQKFWENEKAWIEARDAAFMEALHKLMGKGAELEVENVGGINPRSCDYTNSGLGYNHVQGANSEQRLGGSSICDGGFRFVFGNDDGNIWEHYGAKLGDQK